MLEKANKKGIHPTNMKKTWKEESVLNINEIDTQSVEEINPEKIINWKFHDRPSSELGDIESLANDLAQVGQQQPCIIRKCANSTEKFELIIGERRWHAAKAANLKLKCIIVDYDDRKAALAQAAENDQRKNISEYAKGLSYSNLIEQGVITQTDLISSLGKTKQYVSALLSFTKIPQEIINAIGDMSNISARTAEYIKQLCNKDDYYKKLIIEKAFLIRDGKLGGGNLSKQLQKQYQIDNQGTKKEAQKSTNVNEKFIIKTRKNGSCIIEIPQYKKLNITKKELELQLNCLINRLLSGEKNSPPSGTKGEIT